MTERRGLALVLLLGLAIGLRGIHWGLPDAQRLRILPAGRLAPDAAQKLADNWARLYRDIHLSHKDVHAEETPTYVQGLLEIPPGGEFPPEKLVNSYRSMLLQSAHPDEKKSFIILSHMKPRELDFKPFYIFYGGSFIYPLGAFLELGSLTGAVRVAGLAHYLQWPEDMGRAYLAGRLFVLLFHLGSLWILFDLGRRLSGWRTGFCAALFFALCPAVVEHSHVLKPHPYAAFWTLAALRWLLAARATGERRNCLLCGAAAGMAAGANFSLGALLALPVLAKANRRRSLEGLACAAGTFVVTNPYLFLNFRDYAWDMHYGSHALSLWPGQIGPMLSSAAEGMETGLLFLAAAGAAAALRRAGERRLLALVLCGTFATLWPQFGAFARDPASLRLYYSLLGLGCLLGADLLCSAPLPRALKALALSAILLDSGLRSWVLLENMRLDSGPQSNRFQAAFWIEGNIPAGSKIGLVRFPEPSHTPPFRYDLYHLVLFDRPGALKPGREPEYVVVDARGKASIDAWARKNYDSVAAFAPVGIAWARAKDGASFVNEGMFVYRRKRAPRKPS